MFINDNYLNRIRYSNYILFIFKTKPKYRRIRTDHDSRKK